MAAAGDVGDVEGDAMDQASEDMVIGAVRRVAADLTAQLSAENTALRVEVATLRQEVQRLRGMVANEQASAAVSQTVRMVKPNV